jgi:ATP-dependent Clp protease protease subunit
MNPYLRLLASNKARAGRHFEVVAKGEDSAEVFLYDAIVADESEAEWFGGVAPQSFVKALRAISAGTIHLRINSPGGSVFAARAIEQALREHPAKVVAHIDGLAASAATFIAMAADEIIIAPGSLFMIHKAWSGAYGNADDLRATADLLEKIDGTLVDTYATRTGAEKAAIADWMAAETWFTAEEAVAHGFADQVAEQAAKASAGWDLSAYAKAPAQTEPAAPPAEPLAPAPAAFNAAPLLRRLALATIEIS